MEYKENKRETGTRKEELAADFLTRRGVKILERNFRCRQCEIDLIGMDGQYLVFVEVKYRKTARNGMPAEAVGHIKQQRIRYTAQFYLYSRHYHEDMPCRFDVVGILGTEVQLLKNAFDFVE